VNQAQPTFIDQHIAHARKLVAAGEQAEAAQLLQTIAVANPDNGRIWHELGTVLFNTAAYDKAVQAYSRRLTLDPQNAMANYSLGAALVRLGRAGEISSVTSLTTLMATSSGCALRSIAAVIAPSVSAV
jgi:cytochrome c-type biogenesis protein CcmH/NrfG